jgi:hypothetical protein
VFGIDMLIDGGSTLVEMQHARDVESEEVDDSPQFPWAVFVESKRECAASVCACRVFEILQRHRDTHSYVLSLRSIKIEPQKYVNTAFNDAMTHIYIQRSKPARPIYNYNYDDDDFVESSCYKKATRDLLRTQKCIKSYYSRKTVRTVLNWLSHLVGKMYEPELLKVIYSNYINVCLEHEKQELKQIMLLDPSYELLKKDWTTFQILNSRSLYMSVLSYEFICAAKGHIEPTCIINTMPLTDTHLRLCPGLVSVATAEEKHHYTAESIDAVKSTLQRYIDMYGAQTIPQQAAALNVLKAYKKPRSIGLCDVNYKLYTFKYIDLYHKYMDLNAIFWTHDDLPDDVIRKYYNPKKLGLEGEDEPLLQQCNLTGTTLRHIIDTYGPLSVDSIINHMHHVICCGGYEKEFNDLLCKIYGYKSPS